MFPSALDLVLTKLPDTILAIKLLAPLETSGHALLAFKFGLRDSHEPTRPRAKFCNNEQVKGLTKGAASCYLLREA